MLNILYFAHLRETLGLEKETVDMPEVATVNGLVNQLRARGHSIADSAVEGAVLRLRPIMMTTLVATLGLLPAAMSTGIGSDSQRPFAVVIVGGLMVAMFMNLLLLPTLYVWIAREDDVLPAPEADFDEQE